MKQLFIILSVVAWSTAALAGEQCSPLDYWQSPERSVNDKATWVATYFATNACTFSDVTHLLGKPDDTSRTGTEVAGFSMQYDALYRFTNGTIDLVFLLPYDKKAWADTVLYSVRHLTHRTQRDIYVAKWEERKIATSQQRPARVRSLESAVMIGLRALKKAQNEDGSWGTGDRRCLATSLVLMAMLGHGERESSHEFGATVARAHNWVMAATPSNNEERIAMVASLSEYDALHFGGGRDLAKREVAKVIELMTDMAFRRNDPWTDYLTLHRTPPELTRPPEIACSSDYVKGWKDRDADMQPTNITAYVALFAAFCGKSHQGGRGYEQFNRAARPKMVERQTNEGYWPASDDGDRFACTALAIESMGVYYMTRTLRWPVSEDREQENANEKTKAD